MNHQESQIQQACVRWFRLQYPHLKKLLIAVPNGGYRNAREAGIMKGEGVVPGVADLLLLVPMGGYACLGIEMKTEKGRQSPNQKEWESEFIKYRNKYVICKNFDQFYAEINNYLLGAQ